MRRIKSYRPLSLACFSLQGKDAPEYLHRISTVEVSQMPVGGATRALILTGTSTLVAAFLLFRTSKDGFFLICEPSCASLLEKELERLHFGEAWVLKKIEAKGFESFENFENFESLENPHPSPSSLPIPQADLFPYFSYTLEGNYLSWPMPVLGWTCCINGEDFLGGWQLREEEAFWERLRILCQWPRHHQEWENSTPALQAGFLSWIHREKGCYPGQEVIEKSLNLGKPPKTLVQLTSDQELTPGMILKKGDLVVGKITSAVSKELGGALALGVVKWSYRIQGTCLELERGTVTVESLQLKEGKQCQQ